MKLALIKSAFAAGGFLNFDFCSLIFDLAFLLNEPNFEQDVRHPERNEGSGLATMETNAPNEPNFKLGNRAAMLLGGSRSTPVRQESVFQTPNEPNFDSKLFEYTGLNS